MKNIYSLTKAYFGEWHFRIKTKEDIFQVFEKTLNSTKDLIIPLRIGHDGQGGGVINLRTNKRPVQKIIQELIAEKQPDTITIYAGAHILKEKNKKIILTEKNSKYDKTTEGFPFEIDVIKSKPEEYRIIFGTHLNIWLPILPKKGISYSEKGPYDVDNQKLSRLNNPLLKNTIQKIKETFAKDIIYVDYDSEWTLEAINASGLILTENGFEIKQK